MPLHHRIEVIAGLIDRDNAEGQTCDVAILPLCRPLTDVNRLAVWRYILTFATSHRGDPSHFETVTLFTVNVWPIARLKAEMALLRMVRAWSSLARAMASWVWRWRTR